MMELKERLIVALDVSSFEEAEEIVSELKDQVGYFKVGSQLFTLYGPKIIEMIRSYNAKIFLDLKYHDIPHTVYKAVQAASTLGVDIIDLHCLGGRNMMKAAIKGAMEGSRTKGFKKPILIGVTVLTSLDNNIWQNELHIVGGVEEHVKLLALLAKESGLNGVVASPNEVVKIKQVCGEEFIVITPGIRPKWFHKDDQVRITTPSQAMQLGSDFIVVGRPIISSSNKSKAVKMILDEMVL